MTTPTEYREMAADAWGIARSGPTDLPNVPVSRVVLESYAVALREAAEQAEMLGTVREWAAENLSVPDAYSQPCVDDAFAELRALLESD